MCRVQMLLSNKYNYVFIFIIPYHPGGTGNRNYSSCKAGKQGLVYILADNVRMTQIPQQYVHLYPIQFQALLWDVMNSACWLLSHWYVYPGRSVAIKNQTRGIGHIHCVLTLFLLPMQARCYHIPFAVDERVLWAIILMIMSVVILW